MIIPKDFKPFYYQLSMARRAGKNTMCELPKWTVEGIAKLMEDAQEHLVKKTKPKGGNMSLVFVDCASPNKHKEWLLKHPDYNKNRCKKWREKHPEYDREHYLKFKEDNPEYGRERYKKDKEKMNAVAKQWALDNPEERLAITKKYQRTEKGRANHQRCLTKRRANMKDIINTLTMQEWLDILEQCSYRCVYCGVEFECENLPTRDHIIPISKDGNNTKENIVPACRSCNSKKYIKILEGDLL